MHDYGIEYRKGDIFTFGEEYIVHGCNCFNTMGAGIARRIAGMYPNAKIADAVTQRGLKAKLGSYTHWTGDDIVTPGNTVTIINAYTQYRYSRHEMCVDYDAIAACFCEICEFFPSGVISMPKIGAGLAGGDWNTIEDILDEISCYYDRVFRIYEL